MPEDKQQELVQQHHELEAIHKRLDAGDNRMSTLESALAENTELTREIAANTAGFVAFQGDLENGARFFCRVVKGVQFVLKDVVEPYWKPALVVFGTVYLVTHDGMLPRWMYNVIAALIGG